ncbi:MAG: C25 family cysteine peptidase [Muribaculaceae bacterium]|nr:C25 family cysteine peptidase [Muribaculaceae bacterium]
MKRNIIPRRYALSAVALAAALLAPTRADAGELTTTRTYDTSAITLTTATAPDGTEYQKIEWPGIYNSSEVGEPELPVEYFRFLVPVYSKNFKATAISFGSATTLPLTTRVYPGQIPHKADGSPAPDFTYPLEAAYSSPAEVEAWVDGDGFVDGCNHLVTVAVRPVRYDDATLTAKAYGDITVRLSYDVCSESELTGSKPLFPPKASRYFNLDELCVNSVDVPRFVPKSVKRASDNTGAAATGEYSDWYYIIVPRNLQKAVGDLATWKRQKGYNVVVKTIEDILATPEYAVNSKAELVDEAASLREYLRDEFNKNGSYFCLLVGNSKTSMPIRKAQHYSLYGSNDELSYTDGKNFIPTDWYFSDLNTHYNLINCGSPSLYSFSYSEISSKHSLSIYVGRLLCSTERELSVYTDKLIFYESNPGYGKNGYLGHAFIFEQYKDKSANLIGTSEGTRKEIDFFDSCDLMQSDASGNYATGKQVVERMKNKGFISWFAHGNPLGFGTAANRSIDGEKNYYVTSVDEIVHYNDTLGGKKGGITDSYMLLEEGNGLDNVGNSNFPSIVYTISCENIPYDIMRGKYNNDKGGDYYINQGPNLGESFTNRIGYGGPAFLGNTRDGYIRTSPGLEELFFRELKSFSKPGIAEALSKFNYINNDNRLTLTHNLVGDPEFEMWLGKPKTYTATPIITSSSISFMETLPDSTKVVVYDGLGNSESFYPSSGTSTRIIGGEPYPYPKYIYDMAISTWKTGYLPTITYYGQGIGLTNMSKSYVVRDARLGGSSKAFTVGENASLKVKAIDEIKSVGAFGVKKDGKTILECLRTVSLDNCAVEEGGEMNVEAESTKLGAGFKVAKGGTLRIQKRK